MDIGIILPLGGREKDMALLLWKKLKGNPTIISFFSGEHFTSPLDFEGDDDIIIFDNLYNFKLISPSLMECRQRIFLIPFDLFTDFDGINQDLRFFHAKIPRENLTITSSIGEKSKSNILKEIYSSSKKKERKLILTSESFKINDGVNFNYMNSDEIETFIDAFNEGEIDNIISPFVPPNIRVDTIIIFENYFDNLNDALMLFDAKKKMTIKLIGDQVEMDDVQEYYNDFYEWWQEMLEKTPLLKI